jgi:hypothetical protein
VKNKKIFWSTIPIPFCVGKTHPFSGFSHEFLWLLTNPFLFCKIYAKLEKYKNLPKEE